MGTAKMTQETCEPAHLEAYCTRRDLDAVRQFGRAGSKRGPSKHDEVSSICSLVLPTLAVTVTVYVPGVPPGLRCDYCFRHRNRGAGGELHSSQELLKPVLLEPVAPVT